MLNKNKMIAGAAAFLILVLIAGCAETKPQPVQEVAPPPQVFPPQNVIKNGDYAAFLAENNEILKNCTDPEQCTVALFNISFLYSYSKSPYYNPPKALKYIDDLIKGAPDSPYTYQAMVWKDTITKGMKQKSKKKPSREELKQKEATEAPVEEAAKPAETPSEYNWEADRQRLQEEIRAKEETIKGLNKQIERSRQIDIEIEKKERGLLY